MEAVVHVNGEEHYRKVLTRDELVRGWIEMPCPSCRGTGQFVMPDDEKQDCVECKTSGSVMVSV